MFSNNNGISARQMKRLLVFDMLSISILIVPYIGVTFGGKNGLAVIVVSAAAAIIYGSFLFWIGKSIVSADTRTVSISYLSCVKNAVGKPAGIVFFIFYFIKFLLIIVFLLTLFSDVIGETMLPDTNRKIILATLLLTCAYGASKGMEKRARLTEVLYFIVLIPIFLFLVLGLKKVDLANLTPFISNIEWERGGFSKAVYFVFLTYSAFEFQLFAIPYLQKSSHWKKTHHYVLQSALIIGVLQLLIYIVTVGTLGIYETEDKLWSAVTTMQIVELPGGFVRRQDGIMLAFWLISIFTVLSTCFFYLVHIGYDFVRVYILESINISSPKKYLKRRYFIICYTILIFGIAISYMDIQTDYISMFMKYIGMPGSIILPAIVLGAIKIRKGVDKIETKNREGKVPSHKE